MGIKMTSVSFDEAWLRGQLADTPKKWHAHIRRVFRNGIRQELCPLNGRQSFYGKANVFTYFEDGFLISYTTIVSVMKNGVVTRLGKWTNTTSVHQRTYERRFGHV